MLKKYITLFLIVALLLFSLCSCTFYFYNLPDLSISNEYKIGESLESLIEAYGEPDLINKLPPEHFNKQGENEAIISVCYKMEKRKLIGFEPTEYCYFGFDTETGLVNVIIRPWYLPEK